MEEILEQFLEGAENTKEEIEKIESEIQELENEIETRKEKISLLKGEAFPNIKKAEKEVLIQLLEQEKKRGKLATLRLFSDENRTYLEWKDMKSFKDPFEITQHIFCVHEKDHEKIKVAIAEFNKSATYKQFLKMIDDAFDEISDTGVAELESDVVATLNKYLQLKS